MAAHRRIVDITADLADGWRDEQYLPDGVVLWLPVSASRRQLRNLEAAAAQAMVRLPCVSPGCSTVASVGPLPAHDGRRRITFGQPAQGPFLCIRSPFEIDAAATHIWLRGTRAGGHGAWYRPLDQLPAVLTIACRNEHVTPLKRAGLRSLGDLVPFVVTSRAGD